MMGEYLPMECFKAVYVVDLCHSLCEVAKRKVQARGWRNVHVVEADACTFKPPGGAATLVTFSYSLSSGWRVGSRAHMGSRTRRPRAHRRARAPHTPSPPALSQ